ncbi:hypothetical protein ABDK75_06540 [Gluconobacter sp. OJA]|uniref:hypothetical protein n=1 Tax=Gluconobacter sp. OJA TaxID=3145197 RepID=UPI0031F9E63A
MACPCPLTETLDWRSCTQGWLHEVVRLVELEHYLLRGRLDGLKAESEAAHILEGVIVLGAVLNQKLAHLLGICREVGRL